MHQRYQPKILTIEGNEILGYELTWKEYGQVVCFRHQMIVPNAVVETATKEGYVIDHKDND
jgi:hypothetical protein